MSSEVSKDNEDQITTFLRQCQSQNSNLHDHLCEMLTKIPSDKFNGVIHFERISESFKKIKFEA